ncbi:MAG: 4-hydroxyphenylacetate 3-hydroxylase [Nonomuraea sp.]|nr:4-hydroxyphenylacetate 3-hydroxylase [Nonomuraea sp.]
MTGDRYRESLDDGREVWLSGEKVKNVADHPAFAGTVNEFARLYDWAHDCDGTTFEQDGKKISWSYQLPRNEADLRAKARNSRLWMRESWGQLGRSPDFMANVTVGLHDFAPELGRFGDNAVAYHRFAAENDLALTHALGDPQIDRSRSPLDDPDLGLRIVRETDDGIVLRGAKQLATLAPFANEVLVYLSASFALRGAEEFVVWFALPMNAPGLKILCREPLGDYAHGHSHPFARRFDEQDAMLFFEDVVVPWERVFLMHDGPLALRGLGRINAWSVLSSVQRFQERITTLYGIAVRMAASIGVDSFRGIQEDLGELAGYLELNRLATEGMLATGRVTPGGLYAPGDGTALGIWEAQTSERVVEVVRRIGASGILMQPSEGDLDSQELRPFLDRYMKGKDIGVAEKSRLFRLAWDLVADGFGQRQELYEYLHRGDIGRNRTRLYHRVDRSDVDARLDALLSGPLTG